MIVEVKRFADNGNATLSAIYVDGVFVCFGVEDEERAEKKAGETRVPNGEYYLTLRSEGGFHNRYKVKFSDFHLGMLAVHNKPNYVLENAGLKFQYVLIHVGNYESNTEGCLLTNFGVNAQSFEGSSSVAAYKVFYQKVAPRIAAGEKAKIIYSDVETGK